ncbi:winged helix-turn-helix transcriptional regulator [Spiroplasma turonicum]|uniref:Transcriptional regulator, HxlR family n=1 Tax=Spiroplasma turonicum TaxID=216946 RepID=A0A0K1P4Z2_9MOLU|nr:helix-turn-helix domain-containing protein [Spiroplasma turonicum]AKU79375.1 Transcriptional regulator, HxlR family [Spiroplasma turonicum]ALX70397.1 MarR family transcriptional regulator [Spiroplasma turonicum]
MNSCPVEYSLQILKNKWTILIIRELLKTELRFNELKKKLNTISTKVLTENLRFLEFKNIILRNEIIGKVTNVYYSLSDIGFSLKPVLDALANWGIEQMKKNKKVTMNCDKFQ